MYKRQLLNHVVELVGVAQTQRVQHEIADVAVACEHEHTPKDLIRAVLDEHDTEDLTYEQAAKMVTFEAVLHQIADEVSEKWPDAGQKFAQAQGGGIQSLIDKPVAPFSASDKAVSYTHLDVYKRQV